MAKFDPVRSKGDVMHRLDDLQRQINRLGTARTAAATSVSDGGIVVNGGAGVTVNNGGFIRANYNSGVAAAWFGSTSTQGHGLLVQRDEEIDGSNPNVFGAFQTNDLDAQVVVGEDARPVEGMWVYANNIVLDAADQGGWTFITHDTTSDPANCYIAVSGAIRRSTSASKYKQDIEPADVAALADAVLELQPVTWRDIGQVIKDPDTDRRYLGFTAEDVEAAGLDILVTRDEDTGEAEGLAYGQITAPLVALAQRQQREINELRGLVDHLLDRVTALEEATDAEV